MAHITGVKGKVEAGVTIVAGVTSWTIDTEGDVLETTDFDSDGVKDFIAGNTGWSGTFEAIFDTAQDISADPPNLNEGQMIALKLLLDDTIAPAEMSVSGSAIITGVSITTPQADKITYTVTFQGTGTLTKDFSSSP